MKQGDASGSVSDSQRQALGRKRRWWHALWVVPLAVLLLENLVLWTPTLRYLIQKAPPVRLDYDFAYTIMPGNVTVYGLHLTVSDRAIQMQVDADRAVAEFGLAGFLNETIHVRRLRGDAVRLRLRPVLSEEAASAAWVAHVPPIDGIPLPPIWRHPERPKKPTEKLWKINIEDLDATLAEAWLGPVRIQGDGRVTGGFELHPRAMLHVRPTRLNWGVREDDENAVDVGVGEQVLSEHASFSLDVTVPPFEFGTDASLVNVVEARVATHFPFERLHALSALIPGDALSIGRARGTLDLQVGLERGRLSPDSRLELAAAPAELLVNALGPPFSLAGKLEVDAHLTKDGGRAVAELEWFELKVEEQDKLTKSLGPSLKRLWAKSEASLGVPLTKSTFVGAELRVEGLVAPDLRFFSPALEATPLTLKSGHGHASAQVTVDSDFSAEGYLEVHVSDVLLATDALSTHFASTLKAEVGEHPDTGVLRLHPVTLQVKPLTLNVEGHSIPWSFVLSTQRTTINTKTGRKLSYLHLSGPSLEPFLEAMIEQGALKWAGKLLLGEGGTEADVRLSDSDGTVRLDLLAAKSGRLAVDGVLVVGEKKLLGAFLILGTVLRVGIVVPEDESRIHPTASRAWLERELARQGIVKIAHQKVKAGHGAERRAKRAKRRAEKRELRQHSGD